MSEETLTVEDEKLKDQLEAIKGGEVDDLPVEEEVLDEEYDEPNKEVNEAVEKATSSGWKPREEFEGDPDEWVDADEFLRRRPLFDSLHKANRKTKQLEKEVAGLVAFQKQQQDLFKKERETLVEELRKATRTAAQENDAARMLEIDDQIEEIEKNAPVVSEVAEPEESDPVYDAWVEKNAWYEEDDDMAAHADAIGARLQKKGITDNEELLDQVAAKIKELYPQKFGNKKRTKPAKVGGGTPPATPRATGAKITYSDLPSEAKMLYRRLVKSKNNPHGIMTSEEYLSQYDAVSGANS